MHFKRIFGVIFITIFLGLMGWLFFEASQPEVLPAGSMMPKLEYKDIYGTHILQPDSSRSTMIVLFHRNCEYCVYQLQKLNDHLHEFNDTKLVFLTIERKFFENASIEEWNVLAQARNVQWGIVDKDEFKNDFGSMVTPYIFFFNKSGKLSNKIRGEVRLAKILSLKNSGGPERQVNIIK